MRVGVGQPHRRRRPGRCGPAWWRGRAPRAARAKAASGGPASRRASRSRGGAPAGCGAERAHLVGQGALLVLVEVGGHPGVEHDERAVARDGGGDRGAGRSPCRPARAGGVRRGRARWPARRAGARSGPGCPATGRPAATARRRRRRGRPVRGRGRPARPWRAGGARAGASRSSRAAHSRATPEPRRPGGEGGVARRRPGRCRRSRRRAG